MQHIRTNFLSESEAKGLLNYKYAGSDASLLYKHIFSPLAQYVVDRFFPPWLAPNLITLSGFLCCLIPHLLVWAYTPWELTGAIPGWVCLLCGIGQLLYIVLDNADGKQARKTGNSSPLGLLFDHGCDAMNTFIIALNTFAVLQLGNGVFTIWGYLLTFSVFYFATWEEFYVEALNLPVINGANEGQVGTVLIFLISAFAGNDIWSVELVGPIALKHIIVLGLSGLGVFTIIGNLNKVKLTVPEKWEEALVNLRVYAALAFSMIFYLIFSNEHVVHHTARFFIYFVGFTFAKLIGMMQACHCAHAPFHQYQKTILGSLAVFYFDFLTGLLFSPVINEETMVYLLATFAFFAHIHFIYNIIIQFTEVLGIRVFKVKDTADIERRVENTPLPLPDNSNKGSQAYSPDELDSDNI